MTESIGKYLKTLCSGFVNFYLSEAETQAYPYAVYNQTVEPKRDKDGVYKYVAESTIRVFSKDFDQAQQVADSIQAALDGNTNEAYVIRLLRQTKRSREDVNYIELVYYVKQTK